MKIVVCISHVPDTASKINISADGKTIIKDGLTFIINPYDEFAVEEALKTKEKFGGEVTAISLGDDSNKESLRKALAMGVDNAILLKTDQPVDSIAVAKALAEAIKEINPELVFMGKQSVDFDNSITGQLVSELLGFNSVSVVVSLNIDGTKVIAEREIEGGKEIVETQLPCVITTQKGLNEPRYASLKGIMASKKKVIEEKVLSNLELSTEIVEYKKPTIKQAGKIVGTDLSAVPELVRLLHEEAKVI